MKDQRACKENDIQSSKPANSKTSLLNDDNLNDSVHKHRLQVGHNGLIFDTRMSRHCLVGLQLVIVIRLSHGMMVLDFGLLRPRGHSDVSITHHGGILCSWLLLGSLFGIHLMYHYISSRSQQLLSSGRLR